MASSPRPKILLISSNSSGRGGGERYLVFLSLGLIQIGCDVEVLISNHSYMDGWEEELRLVGALVRRAPLIGLRDRPLRFVQSIFDNKQKKIIAEICNEVAPDAAVVNRQYDEDGLDYVSGALASGVHPVASIIHMPMTESKNQRPLGKLRGKIVSHWHQKNKHLLVFSSKGGETEFQSYYGTNLDTTVIESGVLFSPYGRNPKLGLGESFKLWLSEGTRKNSLPIIGFVGQFVPQKNLDMVVDAWLKLDAKARLLLIGDGPDRAAIEAKLSKTVSRDLWHITGWRENYLNFVKHIDLFVMPSHYEGLPLALIEVVGNGVPAIISSFNGAKEIGLRAPWVHILAENSSRELADFISEKLRDLEKIKLQAHQGREDFKSHFSPARMAKDFLRALDL